MNVQRLNFLILFGLILSTFNSKAMPEKEKKYKVIEMTVKSMVINVSADSLWGILREFDKVANWTSTLDHSAGSGEPQFEGTTCNERVCEASNIGGVSTVHEELTLFDNQKRELAYELTEGAPGFVKLAKNHWQVIEVGPNQSLVQMNITTHLSRFVGFFLGKKLKSTIYKQIDIVQQELKIYAETGEVSAAKKAQLEELKRKQ